MTEDYLTYESKQTLADYIQFVYNMEPTIKLVIGTSNLDKVKKDERDDIDYTLKILKIKNIDNAIFLHTPFHKFNIIQVWSQFDGYEHFRFQQLFPAKSNEDYHYLSGQFVDLYIPLEKQFYIPPQYDYPCKLTTAQLYFRYYVKSTIK